MPEQIEKATDSEIKHFEIRRKMIVHEDIQVNSRLSMLILAQGWLVTPSAILLASAGTNKFVILVAVICLAVVALLALYWFSRSIQAAIGEQEKILGRSTSAPHLAFPIGNDALMRALQAEGDEKKDGRSVASGVRFIVSLLWFSMIILAGVNAFV